VTQAVEAALQMQSLEFNSSPTKTNKKNQAIEGSYRKPIEFNTLGTIKALTQGSLPCLFQPVFLDLHMRALQERQCTSKGLQVLKNLLNFHTTVVSLKLGLQSNPESKVTQEDSCRWIPADFLLWDHSTCWK
jgi:hypothetical protein